MKIKPIKYILTVLLFFIVSLLQNSFLPFFSFWGIGIDLVFVIYAVYIFFGRQASIFELLFLSVWAGFLQDIFSVSSFGISMVSMLAIAFLAKKLLDSLTETKDKYPVLYFIPFFATSFILYRVAIGVSSYFCCRLIPSDYGWVFGLNLFYNLFFAIIIFYVFKKIQIKKQASFRH